MWKMVLSDLRCGIKPGLKKSFKRFINFYCYLYLMFLAPVFLSLSGKYFLFYYAFIIPMVFAMLLFTMYGDGVNKALYLCPLSKQERKQYFLIMWKVRAGLPLLLALLFQGALCISGWISPLIAVLVILSILFSSVVLGMYSNMQEMSRVDKRLVYHGAWYAVVLILGLFSGIFLVAIVGDIEEPRFTGMEVTVGVILFVAHALTSLAALVKFSRPVMENFVCYEKVKTNPVQSQTKRFLL